MELVKLETVEIKLDSGDEVLPVDKLVVAKLLDKDVVLIPEADIENRVAADVVLSVDRAVAVVLSVPKLVTIIVVLITVLEIELSWLVVVTWKAVLR